MQGLDGTSAESTTDMRKQGRGNVEELQQEVVNLRKQLAALEEKLAAVLVDKGNDRQHEEALSTHSNGVCTAIKSNSNGSKQVPVHTAPAQKTVSNANNSAFAASSIPTAMPLIHTNEGQMAIMAPSPVPPLPSGIPMNATRVVMHQIVMPADVDRLGICFGGQVLSWIDICAGLSAKMLAKGPCVTAALDAVHFLKPCRLGTVVIVAAMVNRTFNSSMEVGVKVEAEDMRTGVRHHCCSAYLTFVMVGNKGPPPRASLTGSPLYRAGSGSYQPGQGLVIHSSPAINADKPTLPRVIPSTPELAKEHEAAAARREARLQEKSRRQKDPQLARQAELCRLRPITHREGGPTLPPSLTPPWSPHAPGSTAANTLDTYPMPGNRQTAPSPEVSIDGVLGQSGTVPKATSRSSSDPVMHAATNHVAKQSTARSPSPFITSESSEPCNEVNGTEHRATPSSSHTNMRRSGSFGPRNESGIGLAYRLDHPEAAPPLNDVVGSVSRLSVAPSLTRAYMTQSTLPQHANTLGITFGGQEESTLQSKPASRVMSWMEQCAFVSASRMRAPHLLTAAIDSLTFARPTCVGDVLYVTAQVTAIFGSSLEVQVSVHGEDPHVGEIFHCADGFVTLVTVTTSDDDTPRHHHGDQHGHGHDRHATNYDIWPAHSLSVLPIKLPFVLKPTTAAEHLQLQGAVRRREDRLAFRSSLLKDYEHQQ